MLNFELFVKKFFCEVAFAKNYLAQVSLHGKIFKELHDLCYQKCSPILRLLQKLASCIHDCLWKIDRLLQIFFFAIQVGLLTQKENSGKSFKTGNWRWLIGNKTRLNKLFSLKGCKNFILILLLENGLIFANTSQSSELNN